MKRFLAGAVMIAASVAAHAGTWRVLGYDESSQSLRMQHDGVTYAAECLQHVEPSPEADDDSHGIRAGWHAELSTQEVFPCLSLAALVGKNLPEYTTPAAMQFDSFAVEITPLGIFIQHKLYNLPKKDPKAFSPYDSEGRAHEWWHLSVSQAEVK